MITNVRKKFARAQALEDEGRYARAEALYATLAQLPDMALRARRRRIECLTRLQRWPEAAEEVAAVMAATAPPSNRDIKRWQAVRGHLGDDALPGDPVTAFARAERAAGRYPAGELILFTAAAPKTGSTSLSTALAAAMGGAMVNYLAMPPHGPDWGLPWWPAVDALQGCRLVNHCHLSPAPEVMAEFARRPWARVALHLRNPFEAVESMLDLALRQRIPSMLATEPEVALGSDAKLRRWAFSHYLPRLAGWMTGWLELHDAGHPAILGLTTMDQMRRDGQDALARRLLSGAAGIEPLTTETAPRRTGIRLTGDKAVRLTAAEVGLVQAAMPPAMLERFGWTPPADRA